MIIILCQMQNLCPLIKILKIFDMKMWVLTSLLLGLCLILTKIGMRWLGRWWWWCWCCSDTQCKTEAGAGW